MHETFYDKFQIQKAEQIKTIKTFVGSQKEKVLVRLRYFLTARMQSEESTYVY